MKFEILYYIFNNIPGINKVQLILDALFQFRGTTDFMTKINFLITKLLTVIFATFGQKMFNYINQLKDKVVKEVIL